MALAAALALGVVVLVLLWRSGGTRGPERASRAPTAPAPGSAGIPELTPAATRSGAPSATPARESENAGALARLEVLVAWPEGQLLGVARVTVTSEDWSSQEAFLDAGTARTSFDLPPGLHALDVVTSGAPDLGAWPTQVELAPGEERTLVLPLVPAWACTGSVVGPSGDGLAGLPLALEREGLTIAGARTDAQGRFRFPPLPCETVALVVGDPLGPIVPRVPVPLGERPGALEVRVPELLALAVRVVDENGFPVPEAELEGTGESGGRLAGLSDAEGLLEARDLPPGNYRVFASHPRIGRGNRIFVLTPELEGPLEVRLLGGPPPR